MPRGFLAGPDSVTQDPHEEKPPAWTQVTEFAIEFLRVQSDKILLAALLVYFWAHNADERITYSLFGAFMMAIQGRRFKL